MSEQIENYWLVKLELTLGDIEKNATHVVTADTKQEAMEAALYGECHDTPDFEEFPDKDACWDMGMYVYAVSSCEPLTAENNVQIKLEVAEDDS